MTLNQKITPGVFRELYSLLDDPITKRDCGSLCAPANGGVPFCCDVHNAVPLMYKEEYKFLKSRTDIWSPWKPRRKGDEALLEDLASDQIFCECKGVQHCERENRSISCRTFPLEPYIDKRGELVGLVFNSVFLGRCPLTEKKHLVRQAVVDKHFEFWDRWTDLKDDEFQLYYDLSKTLRRRRGQTKKEFVILWPSHLKRQKGEFAKYV